MSCMKIKHNQHKKRLLEQKAVQDKANKTNKSPNQQVQEQTRSNFDKAASNNPVQLAAETNNECAENFSDDNFSSSSKDTLDSDVRTGQIDNQNLLACQTCKKTFPSKSSLTTHMRSHKTEEVTYACDICRKHFPKLIIMQQHRRFHTGETSNGCAENSGDNLSSSSKDMLDTECSVQVDDQEFYTCQTCQKTFDRKSSLTNHMRSHQSQEITYACDICGKRFARLTTMQQHRGLHTVVSTNPAKLAAQTSNGSAENLSSDNSKDKLGSEQCSVQIDDQGLYTCQTCKKKFDKRSSLTNHVRSHQGREMAFACDICGTRFSKLNTMQQHRELHTVASTKSAELLAPETRNEGAETSDDNSWNSEDTYTCQICQRSFDMKSSLSNHMRSHKSEETTYPCDICGKSFSQLTSMQHHRRLHTGETPYLCKVCKKRFRTSAALSCHKRTHTGDNIQKCEYCNKEFVYNFAYETHIRIHTGEKPFECDVCNKKFSQTSALNRHMLIHKAIAPFSCDICLRKFRQRSELKVHMRNHTGERPYPCKTCNRGFTQKSSLVTHMKAHIKKERKRKLAASKEAAVKVKAKPEVVFVKEEREEMEFCEEPEWVETPEEPARVKVEKMEPRARSEEPQDFFVEVPVINHESFEVPLEASNPRTISELSP